MLLCDLLSGLIELPLGVLVVFVSGIGYNFGLCVLFGLICCFVYDLVAALVFGVCYLLVWCVILIVCWFIV